ncbi:MAG: ATP-binding cassette domain-containing protein [Candidatus Eisenbacteria bacterium]|nr:ATP-binding cassette domain-containing protein [Candidatus Eisenbacteria bacterium]
MGNARKVFRVGGAEMAAVSGTESVLTVREATKRFDQTLALDRADLELRPRERLGLLGPNGAGKTTLVRAIAGRVRLDAGRIRLLGAELDLRSPQSRRVRGRIGVVPQEIALYPLLTARENLRSFGELQGLRGHALREHSDWALDWTGLADRADEPIKRFSGGMKRRLNIACSVLHRPEVVLLDEPTVGVDPQSRERIWEMLEKLRQEGAAQLVTTHQLDEAQQICDRIVIIDHGRVIASGSFRQLIADTVGGQRQIALELDGDVPAALREVFTIEGKRLIHGLHDVGRELPALLERVAAGGGTIRDVHLSSPTLQAVFIHLTGRELRE